MPERTLAIIFRNPQPQRSAMRAKLYLIRGDGSSVHFDYSDRGNPINSKQPRLVE